jgi:hypothetical protein
MEFEFSRQSFENFSNIKFESSQQSFEDFSDIKSHENSSSGSRAVPRWQTDGRSDR